MSSELRVAQRSRSLLHGQIVHSGGASRADCTIRDLSATGARIQIPQSITIPEHFELVVMERNQNFKAKIVWRHAAEIGVAFDSATKPAPQPSITSHPGEIRVRMLELEVESAKLRAEVTELKAILDSLMADRRSTQA
ncbi:MAG: pilus assembly protein PilZ [Rhizobiales bacterium PAR1]|nr:MAG: pilus assembly protein PilZ [Rhizobiales bacterium PAR1]